MTIKTVGGKDFDPAATYTIATNDFMASGGDTYYRFVNATANYDLGIPMDEVVMDYITTVLNGTVAADKYGASAITCPCSSARRPQRRSPPASSRCPRRSGSERHPRT